ncbi:MAG: AAA family ATPase [Sphaerochaetaceae bacterium]|nr:AAA family ATPase [Sphaerochaetaceae bacterium]
MTATQKNLSTTISSFQELREKGALYVDKTPYLASMVMGMDKLYFLSRPRRFGKTLTVSTLEAIFQGRRELFKGLVIDSLDYDWKTYPIIHIDFGNCGRNTAEDLEAWLRKAMKQVAVSYGIAVPDLSQHADDVFSDLIDELSGLGKVVILIDEYDKVLSDNIFSDQVEELRTVLGNFYQVIKTKGALLRFVFITGVTRYAMVNEFSGLNNLKNLSLSPAYATMLGYTQKELETNFAGYIGQGTKDTGMGREAYLAKVRDMYDGYRFAPGCETVYNPVSVGNFFNPEDGGGVRFNDYWIETGSSRLVMDMAGSVDLDVTEDLERGMAKSALSSFDVAELRHAMGDMGKVQAFLLQTGYLTIGDYDEGFSLYSLRFPNKEVRDAYYQNLLSRWCARESGVVIRNLVVALRKGDTQGYMQTLTAIFASVPYRAGKKEPDFAQVVDVVMLLSGKAVKVVAEDQTSAGRIDLTVETDRHVYVMEFKADKSAEAALRQIREKRYADKFRLEKGKTVHLLGIAFSSTGHTVQDWKEEVLD